MSSPAALPGSRRECGGIVVHKPRRSGRLSPACVAVPERSKAHAGRPRRAGPGSRHPRLAQGGPAAPSTDTASRGSLKAGWLILLRALLNGESERKSPTDFPVPLVSLLAPRTGARMHRDPVAERERKGHCRLEPGFQGS